MGDEEEETLVPKPFVDFVIENIGQQLFDGNGLLDIPQKVQSLSGMGGKAKVPDETM